MWRSKVKGIRLDKCVSEWLGVLDCLDVTKRDAEVENSLETLVYVILQELYPNPSASALSLVQSNQSDSPNGKIAPAVLLSLMAK